MRNIKLTLEYDGSKFFGFQRQKDKPTIQAALEKALSRLFNQPLKIAAAAGRTDSGVHARGQVVNFKVASSLSRDKIQKGLNALLPHEIVVTQVEEAPPDFHARYGAKTKTYEYLVLNAELRSPLLNGRVYQFPYPLDWAKMRKTAKALVGRHDFKAFQAAGSSVKDTVRSIHRFSISVVPSPLPCPRLPAGQGQAGFPLPRGEKVGVRGGLIRFVIEADGFLYHMVRNIVGTLLEVGRGKLSLHDFSAVLKRRSRSLAGPTIPPRGLTLVSVKY